MISPVLMKPGFSACARHGASENSGSHKTEDSQLVEGFERGKFAEFARIVEVFANSRRCREPKI